MQFHWQNLTAERLGLKKTLKSFAWHGRAFLHLASEAVVRIEWDLGRLGLGFRFAMTPHDEDTARGYVQVPGVAFYWGYGAPFHGSFRRVVIALAGGKSDVSEQFGGREVCVYWHEGSLQWSFWVDPAGWTNSRPKWRNGHLDFRDLLFGKPEYESIEIKSATIRVPMPERTYEGRCVLSEDVWKRPRGLPRRRRRAHIDMKEPIPFPGKGENSWDCGEDALHGLTTDARTVGDAIGAVVSSVMNSRERHGGVDWRPGS
jgi:hypothetical protein